MSESAARYVTSAIGQFTHWGERLAVTCAAGALTFADLLADAHRIARVLAHAGLRRGDGLALLAGNPPEVITASLACALLGVRFTPVYLGRASEPIEHVLRDAAPSAVVFDPARPTGPAGPIAELAHRVGIPHVFSLGPVPGVPDLRTAAAAESGDPLPVSATEESMARLLYTGGTTGAPKGVPYTFGQLTAAAAAQGGGPPPPPGLRFVVATPFAHAAGNIAFGLLRGGAAVELLDDFDAGELLTRIATASAEGYPIATYLYPPYLYQLLDHPALGSTDLSALAFVAYGSSPVSPPRLAEAIKVLGPILRQGYAQTEAIGIASLGPGDHAEAIAGRPELLSSVGRALPGVTIRVAGADGGKLAAGQIGEILVAGPTVMSGYWNRPDLTAGAMTGEFLRTGDLGHLDADGYLYLAGRIKTMVIVNGHNCYVQPIEDALAAHPAVRQVAVTGVPDEHTGEALVAFVIADPDADAGQLRDHVSTQLGEIYAPAEIVFVPEFPVTSLGKADTKTLRAAFLATH